jgi:hypothetical protein
MSRRAASASEFRLPDDRDVRRGRGIRASIVLTSGDGTRAACGSDTKNTKEDVDIDADATHALKRVVAST